MWCPLQGLVGRANPISISKAFEQGEVFPLGHELDPETMGIWMWIVPEKFQVYILSLFN